MPNYGDFLKDIVYGLKEGSITEPQIETLQREFNEFGKREEKYKAWLRMQDNKIGTEFLDLPLFEAYTHKLEKVYSSIIIPIQGGYRNIIIKGSGSVDAATGGNIWAQVNGDAGAAQYAWHLIGADGATVWAAQDTSFHALALGVFGTISVGVGVNGSFHAEIIGYESVVWKKNCLSQIYTAEFNAQYKMGSTWNSTDAINSLEIFGTNDTLVKGTANLLEGCEFSVYLER